MNDRRRALKFALVLVASALASSVRVGLWNTAAHAARQEKTLGQTGKNIKVLTDLPESQTFLLMNFMSDSLGVRCEYCHVNEGGDKWVWDSDAKPEKLTARRMMQMQIEINRGNRDILGTSGTAVTCFTCHRGQTKPSNSPMLPIPVPQSNSDADTKKPAAVETLPTVEQLLDKYVAAVGGLAAFEKLKTRVATGKQTTWNGTELPFETYQKSPGKYLTVLTTPRNGVFYTGFDGSVGWARNERQGVRELAGAQLASLKRAADFYGDLHLQELYTEMTVAGREKVGERDAYVIVSRVSEKRIERLYFDAQTGLLLRIAATTETPLARLPEETVFEDYREVDGVKLPFTIRVLFVDPFIGWTRKFTEIKHNVPVEDSKFAKPALVK